MKLVPVYSFSKAHKKEKVSGSYITPIINLANTELTLEDYRL